VGQLSVLGFLAVKCENWSVDPFRHLSLFCEHRIRKGRAARELSSACASEDARRGEPIGSREGARAVGNAVVVTVAVRGGTP
jgi:hypothetical protein